MQTGTLPPIILTDGARANCPHILPEKELMQKSMHRADCTARFLCAWNKKEIHGNTGGTASAAKGVIRRRLFAFLYELSLKSHPIVYLLI